MEIPLPGLNDLGLRPSERKRANQIAFGNHSGPESASFTWLRTPFSGDVRQIGRLFRWGG